MTTAAIETRANVFAREIARRMECPYRRTSGSSGSCGKVEVRLGFMAGMGMDICDQCWNGGGPDSATGEAVREAMIERTVEHLVARPADRLPTRHVMLTIARRHLPPDRAERYLVDHALTLGERGANEIAAEYPTAAAKMRAAMEVATARQRWDAMLAKDRWGEVRGTWEKAESLLAAVTSGRLDGEDEADVRTVSLRQFSCHGGGGMAACSARRDSKKDGRFYCGECGCGDTSLARLDNKLTYRRLECPRAMPGFDNAIPLEEPHAVQH